jgi:hypothetical protein
MSELGLGRVNTASVISGGYWDRCDRSDPAQFADIRERSFTRTNHRTTETGARVNVDAFSGTAQGGDADDSFFKSGLADPAIKLPVRSKLFPCYPQKIPCSLE